MSLSYPNCCSLRSRSPAMTSLLNGQAVKVRLCSTSVTLRRGSSFLSARAQLAPAKPPPTITTRPPAPWAIAGSGNRAADAPAATVLMKVRRLVWVLGCLMASVLLRGEPGGDGLGLVIGEALGDAIHHGRGPLAGLELGHRGNGLRRVASGKVRHRRVERFAGRVATAARARAGRCVSR